MDEIKAILKKIMAIVEEQKHNMDDLRARVDMLERNRKFAESVYEKAHGPIIANISPSSGG